MRSLNAITAFGVVLLLSGRRASPLSAGRRGERRRGHARGLRADRRGARRLRRGHARGPHLTSQSRSRRTQRPAAPRRRDRRRSRAGAPDGGHRGGDRRGLALRAASGPRPAVRSRAPERAGATPKPPCGGSGGTARDADRPTAARPSARAPRSLHPTSMSVDVPIDPGRVRRTPGRHRESGPTTGRQRAGSIGAPLPVRFVGAPTGEQQRASPAGITGDRPRR